MFALVIMTGSSSNPLKAELVIAKMAPRKYNIFGNNCQHFAEQLVACIEAPPSEKSIEESSCHCIVH